MNPFREMIVASPWDATRTDVPQIHGQVFDRCVAGIEHVRNSQRSAGLLIHGEAGSGKTHLLGRLRAELTPTAPTDTSRLECLYVWVRLQTSPRMIWRTLRRTLVDDWFRPVLNGRTQFERILFHRLAEIRTAEGDLELWYEYMLDEVPDGLDELLERIATSLDLDRNTAIAFRHIAFRRHLKDLRAWLAGTSLPQAALERMDLAQDDGNDEEREDQSRQVVLMLCRLAGNGLPIVLSFDQVEALQMTPRDPEALFAFGQLISTLHDGTSNTLLVSSVQSAFATELKDQARRADYDRMTSLGAFSLDPLTHAQAEQLIARRLEGADLTPAGSWPLAADELTQLIAQNGGVSPRKLLSLCAERFESLRTPAGEPQPGDSPTVAASAPPPRDIPAFLSEKWDSCVEQKLKDSVPDRTEEIVRHGLPLLVRLVSPNAKLTSDDLLRDVELVFEGPQGRTGVSLCTQSNMTSLASRLKRLKSQLGSQRLDRLVILRDSRVPISPGAKTTRQHLEELERQAAVVFPSVEALAALDALRDLLSDAKSGDLACHGEAVPPETVEEWLRAHLARGLQDFVDGVFGLNGDASTTTGSEAKHIELLSALLAQQPVLTLEEAARALQCPADSVIETVNRHPDHFVLLGQPPQVMFRTVDAG